MEVKYDDDNLWDYLISCEDAYTVISYYGGSTYFLPYVKSSTMVHDTRYPLIKKELGVEITTTAHWFDLYYLTGDPQYEHIFVPSTQGVFGAVDVASYVIANIGRFVDYTPETNISPTNLAIFYDAYNYFNTPSEPTGEGSAIINIPIDGENLTFESAYYGTTKTQFISSNTTIDMRPN